MGNSPVSSILKRVVFHALVGSAIGVALLFLPKFVVVIVLAVLTVVALFVEAIRLSVPSLNRRFVTLLASLVRKKEEIELTGSSYFLLGSLVTTLVFPSHIAALAIFFLGWGDRQRR